MGKSVGVAAEIKYARELDIPILYLDLGTMEISWTSPVPLLVHKPLPEAGTPKT